MNKFLSEKNSIRKFSGLVSENISDRLNECTTGSLTSIVAESRTFPSAPMAVIFQRHALITALQQK